MQPELARARAALKGGSSDEALVHLWNAVEPARLAGDEAALREIATLARSIPGREAADLVAATGVQLTEARTPEPEARQAPRRPGRRAFVWLAIVVALAIFNLVQNLVPNDVRTRQPAGRPPGAEPVSVGLHLVPLDRFPAEELGELVPTVAPAAGIVFVRHQVVLAPSTYDPMREQYVAERLLLELRQQFELTGAHTLIIGVTSLDMYSERHVKEERVAVARSDDGVFVVISTFGLGSVQEGRQIELGRAILREIRRTSAEPGV